MLSLEGVERDNGIESVEQLWPEAVLELGEELLPPAYWRQPALGQAAPEAEGGRLF